jgi:DNA-binding response OmpR family regulator
MYKILLVDDDIEIFHLIEDYNQKNKENYTIHYLPSSEKLNDFLNTNIVDLILMDWKLGQESGLQILAELKSKIAFAHIPMILLTAMSQVEDQIQGLDSGADDYIVKPFYLKLLFSKINSHLRKEDKEKNTKENIRHQFIFKDDQLEVEYMGENHKLTAKAFTILKVLVNNPMKVFSQNELNSLTSGKDVHIGKRCIDTFVTNIRKKIGKNSIISIRKKGYQINAKYLDSNSVDAQVSSVG